MSRYVYYNGKIKEIVKYQNWINVLESDGNIFGYPEQEFYNLYPDAKIVDSIQELIEVGDLIYGIESFSDEYSFFQVKAIATTSIITGKFKTVPFQTIKTIYKPNSRGDYIKVWEKEVKK